MTDTTVAGPAEQDFIFSSLSPSLAQKRLAMAIVLFLAVAFLIIAGPLSTLQLAPINAFIPVYATAMFVNDSITAILLFAHFSILRSRALLVLSSGYLFTALIVIPWMLTFPGVFAPSGLLGAGLQSTSWLYILWHAGFPTFVIAYALLKDGDPTRRLWEGSVRVAIFSSIAITAALVCAAAILATAGNDLLPGLMVDTVHLSPLWSHAAGFASLWIVLAIVVLWIRRRTTLDLWLMAVMFAFAIEIGLISFPVPARYTVGWYGGRICGLVSGSLLLFVLLYEITTVYSRLNARLHSDLQRSEAFLAQAQSISSTGSFGWNVLSGEIYWSEETYKIFELDRAAKPTLGLMLQRVHPEDLALVQETIGCASREGLNFDLAHRLLTPDGRVKHLHVLARALKTPSGNLEFVGAVTDVTERKRAEEEQARLGQRLRQAEKMEAMGTLAGGIAHDFNNILGAILGYGELAQKVAAEGSVGRRYLDNVMQAGARAKSLVERILAFSRSGVTKRGPINVQAVIEEALELLAASLAPGIRLEKRLEAGDAAIVGDATQLHQVAMNLGTNASQAMEHGGVLEVTLDRAEVAQNRRLSHGSVVPGVYVRLWVNDTGSGIPPHVLDRMFDPFFTTKEPGEGTGLGLSLVQSIVADLGGAIDVRTSVGRGTSFTVWLPIAGEMAVLPAEIAPQLPRGNGQSVMIVDDEKPLVGLAEEILAELGYEPIGFSSSTAALEAFRAAPQRFDIVLTDEMMPEVIGTELAREIALLRPDMPIVLMSGYGGAQLPSRACAAGIREILHKPLQRKDIAECLGRILPSLPLTG